MRPYMLGKFSPLKIPNCALWLSGSRGMTLVSGAASSWADQSGNGHHASQSTPGYRPTYTASAINDRPGLTFDATDDFLDLTATFPDIMRDIPGITLCAVGKLTNIGNIFAEWLGIEKPSPGAWLSHGVAYSGGAPYSWCLRGSRLYTDSQTELQTTALASTDPIIFISIFDFVNQIARIRINGSVAAEDLSFGTAGYTSDVDSGNVVIGIFRSCVLDATICETAVYQYAVQADPLHSLEYAWSREYDIALAA